MFFVQKWSSYLIEASIEIGARYLAEVFTTILLTGTLRIPHRHTPVDAVFLWHFYACVNVTYARGVTVLTVKGRLHTLSRPFSPAALLPYIRRVPIHRRLRPTF